MKQHKAFTLIDCIVALSLLCILLSGALFTYRHLVFENQLVMSVRQLTNTLEYARDSAITLATTVRICPENKAGNCSSNWQNALFIKNESTGQLLRIIPAIKQPYTLYWRSTLRDSDELIWRPNGWTDGQQGSFFICLNRLVHGQSAQLILLRTGRLRVVIGKIKYCE